VEADRIFLVAYGGLCRIFYVLFDQVKSADKTKAILVESGTALQSRLSKNRQTQSFQSINFQYF
jgi:hypothetical protein